MDFTCENCKSRYTWDCDDGYARCLCEFFELDENTLTEEERMLLRVLTQIFRENSR